MALYTEQLSQALGVVGSIHSASQAVGTALTEAIDLSKGRRFLFVADIGSVGASGTAVLGVQGATSQGGSYTAIANLNSATVSTSNQVIVVEATNEQIQGLGLGYTWI